MVLIAEEAELDEGTATNRNTGTEYSTMFDQEEWIKVYWDKKYNFPQNKPFTTREQLTQESVPLISRT